MIGPLKICPNCDGRGFNKATMECEDSIIFKCKVCDSKGKIDGEKYFFQTYTEPHGSITFYNGPVLDKKLFKDLKINED